MGFQHSKVRVSQDTFFFLAHKVSKGFTVKWNVLLSSKEVSCRDSRIAMKVRN